MCIRDSIIDGAPAPTDSAAFGAGYNVVSPEYFQVMGMDLVRGRAFTPSDETHGRDVAIVSESTAQKYWPGKDAIGHTFRMASDKNRELEVVGIVRDAEFQIFGGAKSRPFFYIPYAQHIEGNTLMVFQLRTAGDPMALAQTAEKAIHSLAPQLPLFQAVSYTHLDVYKRQATNGMQPQRILTSYVSGNFFSVLGLKPAAGRLFLPSEGEVLGSDPIVVLDYDSVSYTHLDVYKRQSTL